MPIAFELQYVTQKFLIVSIQPIYKLKMQINIFNSNLKTWLKLYLIDFKIYDISVLKKQIFAPVRYNKKTDHTFPGRIERDHRKCKMLY